ncbi:hypothetical protein FA95DRAFT_1612133 [Auriscalpium vulgare]|uniref:Uncharacterized protein n=1 Tax=Auriscalpium vulgare TaxID=40419 RepID=A0ACB8R7M8_9AGAM|nr:hypothetical protein FA95DRAFT_1612133 [Auriscalpium vulgare]
MIRRDPTLIAMSDADVHDIRILVARKKAERLALASASANGKGKDKAVPVPAPAPAVHVAAEEAQKARKAMSTEERRRCYRSTQLDVSSEADLVCAATRPARSMLYGI